MPQRLTSSTRGFGIPVAHFSSGTYPPMGVKIRDVSLRSGFTAQQMCFVGPGSLDTAGHSSFGVLAVTDAVNILAAHEASFTVNDNDFSGGAVIRVGPYELSSGEDFAVGGTVAATATNIATAITNLPGFSAAAVVAAVTVTGRKGLQGRFDRFELRSYGPKDNFTSVVGFAGGSPDIAGPTIT